MGNSTTENLSQYVVKSNDLIRRTRYTLTTQQHRIMLYAISKIKPNDTPETTYEIDIKELCAVCGIKMDGTGYYYKAIKDDLIKLTTRIWFTLPDKTAFTVSWISDAMIIPLSGKVYIKFHERLAPYLFQLRENYTQYQLRKAITFKGTYTIRLYELLKSYTTRIALENGDEQEARFTLDELRDYFNVTAYKRWADFDRYVIRKAVDEINLCNDEMKISYDVYKVGHAVKWIMFIISAPSVSDKIKAHEEERNRLRIVRKRAASAPTKEINSKEKTSFYNLDNNIGEGQHLANFAREFLQKYSSNMTDTEKKELAEFADSIEYITSPRSITGGGGNAD